MSSDPPKISITQHASFPSPSGVWAPGPAPLHFTYSLRPTLSSTDANERRPNDDDFK